MSSPAVSSFRAHEAQRLVDMARLSRVTLLVAEPGSDKSALLRSTVMPLLERDAAGAKAEIAILFDAWDEAPLSALQARVEQVAAAALPAAPIADRSSLPASLRALQEALGVTFLIIFDCFEEYLRTPQERSGVAEFEARFVEIANDRSLQVNFLLAFDADAEPLLARLSTRIPQLRDARVRLPRAAQVPQTPPLEHDVESEPHHALRTEPVESGERTVVKPNASPTLPAHVEPAAPLREAAAANHPKPGRKAESSIVVAWEALHSPTARTASAGQQHAGPATEVDVHALKESASQPSAQPNAVEAPQSEPVPVTKTPSESVKATPPLLAETAPALLAETAASPIAETVPPPIDEAPPPLAQAHGSEVPKPIPQEPRPPARAAPKRRLVPLAWAALMLIAGALLVLWERGSGDRAEIRTSSPTGETLTAAPRGEAPSKPEQNVVAASPPPVVEAPAPSPPTAKPSAPPQPPADAVSAPSAVQPETALPKVAQVPPPAPVEAVRTPQPARKSELFAGRPRVAPSAVPSAAPTAVQRAVPPKVAAKAPPVAAAPPARAEVPAGPTLYINIASEAQRARAEQLVQPLNERGIRVAGIRVVPPNPDGTHIRYNHNDERNEAMKLSIALRDFGLGTQHLRQAEESVSPVRARQYELWLPATGESAR